MFGTDLHVYPSQNMQSVIRLFNIRTFCHCHKKYQKGPGKTKLQRAPEKARITVKVVFEASVVYKKNNFSFVLLQTDASAFTVILNFFSSQHALTPPFCHRQRSF
jgi:hypothetical protein